MQEGGGFRITAFNLARATCQNPTREKARRVLEGGDFFSPITLLRREVEAPNNRIAG